MKISKLIEALQELQARVGDATVEIESVHADYAREDIKRIEYCDYDFTVALIGTDVGDRIREIRIEGRE